jgi:hypothetical protein
LEHAAGALGAAAQAEGAGGADGNERLASTINKLLLSIYRPILG